MTYQPKHAKPNEVDEFWDALWTERSERDKVKYKPFEKDYCQEFSDCLDGFVIHAPTCPMYQHTAWSGTDCINFRHVSTWPTGLSEVR